MPLYEYRCTKCGHRYEKIQKFDAEPDTACAKCGGELHRPLTAPALQFKGAGWYVNDYSSKAGSSSQDKAGESGEAKPATESKNSTESKAAGESKGAAESKPAAAESKPKPAAAPSTSSTDS